VIRIMIVHFNNAPFFYIFDSLKTFY